MKKVLGIAVLALAVAFLVSNSYAENVNKDIQKDKLTVNKDTREIKSDKAELKEAVQSGDQAKAQEVKKDIKKDVKKRRAARRNLKKDKKNLKKVTPKTATTEAQE